jgi:PilZ domain
LPAYFRNLPARIESINILTKDLSLFGCFVKTVTPFPEGTKVSLKMSRGEMHLVAQGRVAYSRPNSGMGIAFVTIEPSSLPVLDG